MVLAGPGPDPEGNMYFEDVCIDDLERAGWGVGWHDLGTLGVGRADGTRGPADRRGAPRVGERLANAGGLSGSLPTDPVSHRGPL